MKDNPRDLYTILSDHKGELVTICVMGQRHQGRITLVNGRILRLENERNGKTYRSHYVIDKIDSVEALEPVDTPPSVG